eukprot:923248-Prymnesium_polylepis.1
MFCKKAPAPSGERLCQEFCRARALLGRRSTPCERQRMGTLDAPGAKTPFRCGGGGAVWRGRRRPVRGSGRCGVTLKRRRDHTQ